MNRLQCAGSHTPVMLQETLSALAIDPAGGYIDATYGRGGHSSEILERLGAEGMLFAIDCDTEAIQSAGAEHALDHRFSPIHARFSNMKVEVRARAPHLPISGVFADLGVSSPQLDNPARGFSFQQEGSLDMRMNIQEQITASEWLQSVSEEDLVTVLKTLGEERFARRIARAIVRSRDESPIETTLQLANLVKQSVPTRERNKHPATRTFLAIRMHINNELKELTHLLEQSIDLLKHGGRLVLLTFHSVEDRVVKRFMKQAAIGSPGPDGVPFRSTDFSPTLKIIGKALKPSAREIAINRRARSATLRVAERIGV